MNQEDKTIPRKYIAPPVNSIHLFTGYEDNKLAIVRIAIK
jgi:hypothetical protein